LILLETESFDVGIIDLRLPSMSGEMLILNIYKRWPNMRCVIHTGSVDYRPSEEMLNAGLTLDHVFLKPQANMHCFVETINKLLIDRGV
jgi:DNA-binding NarL/FixJ family response regulator